MAALEEVKQAKTEVTRSVDKNEESINKVQQDQEKMQAGQKDTGRDIKMLREQEDRLESDSRRQNFILHGVPEIGRVGDRERTEDIVVDILQWHMPDGQWHCDHVERAYRIGQRQMGKNRPIVVRMDRATEVAFILGHRSGRASIKKVGYGVSQDLSRNQLATIKQLKGEGKVAYYLRGRLIVKYSDQPQQDKH